MANGRLGSTTVQPTSAALVYSNTSGGAAAVNVQATTLSTSSNAIFSYAIDSASVAINQTTSTISLSSGNVDYQLFWLDPISNTTPVRFQFSNKSNNAATPPNQYWDGSSWTYSGSTSGNFLGFKLDPYFYTNYTEYGKTTPTFAIPLIYSGQSNYSRIYQYNLATGVTGVQLAKMLANNDESNGATALTSYTAVYMGQGQDGDIYTNFVVGMGTDGYMAVWVPTAPSTSYQYTSNSIAYNLFGAQSLTNYDQYWWAPRIIASNGFYVCQGSGYPSSFFAICDQESATAAGSPNQSFYYAASTSGAKWSQIQGSYSGYEISWFEWNPNTEKFYMEYVGGSTSKIYSATKAQIRAVQLGTTQSTSISTAFTLEASTTPWTFSNHVKRPQRIGRSLWQTVSSSGTVYISTDLVTWTTSSVYWPSVGLSSSTIAYNGLSATSYLFAESGVANIRRFSSGFSNVSQNCLIENQTTFSNYQRTGLVLSAGDKLYCQNYGSSPYSISVMGYES